MRGSKGELGRNTTRIWRLTPVLSFSVSLFSRSHTFKASSSHREAGSSTSRVNLADAASHSHSHPSSSTSQYTALVVPSSPAPNVSRKFSIIDILTTDLSTHSYHVLRYSRMTTLLRDTTAAKNQLKMPRSILTSSLYCKFYSSAVAFILVFCFRLILFFCGSFPISLSYSVDLSKSICILLDNKLLFYQFISRDWIK